VAALEAYRAVFRGGLAAPRRVNYSCEASADCGTRLAVAFSLGSTADLSLSMYISGTSVA